MTLKANKEAITSRCHLRFSRRYFHKQTVTTKIIILYVNKSTKNRAYLLTTVCKRATKMKYLKTKCNRTIDNEISAVTYTETITLTVLKSNYLAN